MGKIKLGNGRLEMDTEATGRVMDNLVRHGAQFESARPPATSIATASAAIGKHHSSCAEFLKNYENAVKSIDESVTQVKPTFDTLAQGGRDEIVRYVKVDEEYAAQIAQSGRK